MAILVVVDEPQEEHYGGIVAAPAFRRIALEALNYLNVPPRRGVPIEHSEKLTGFPAKRSPRMKLSELLKAVTVYPENKTVRTADPRSFPFHYRSDTVQPGACLSQSPDSQPMGMILSTSTGTGRSRGSCAEGRFRKTAFLYRWQTHAGPLAALAAPVLRPPFRKDDADRDHRHERKDNNFLSD